MHLVMRDEPVRFRIDRLGQDQRIRRISHDVQRPLDRFIRRRTGDLDPAQLQQQPVYNRY